MPKIKPEYSLLPPEEAKKEDQKQQYPVDQKSKDNLTFGNNENRDKNAATTNKTDAKIGKSDAKPGQIKEKKTKENIILGRGAYKEEHERNFLRSVFRQYKEGYPLDKPSPHGSTDRCRNAA